MISEKEKHLEYLNREKFVVNAPHHLFSEEKLKELERNGHWYSALEKGYIVPISDKQVHFFKAINYGIPLEGMHEKNWKRYRGLEKKWGNLLTPLYQASEEERKILSEILKTKDNNVQNLLKILIGFSQNLFEYSVENEENSVYESFAKHMVEKEAKEKGLDVSMLQDHLSIMQHKKYNSYSKILKKVGGKLKIEKLNVSDKDLERKITVSILKSVVEKMSTDESVKFEEEIIKQAKKDKGVLIETGGAIATLTAANLSGFGVYLLATSTLSAISGIIGVTFSFAIYTAMSSIISVVIGPAGWLSTGAFVLWKTTKVNYKRLIPAIIYIGWLREKYSKD